MEKVDGELLNVCDNDLLILFSNPQKFWEDVYIIGNRAFSKCTQLTSLEIPSHIKCIEKGAFEDCLNLNEIKISDGVEEIKEYAFHKCDVKKINIPGSVKIIKSNIFGFSNALEELILQDGIEEIKKRSFIGLSKLKSIKIPSSVKIIGEEAFSCCYGLKEVVFSEGLEEIESKAFKFCNDIQQVELPKSLQSIGSYTFGECYSINQIIVNAPIDCVDLDAFEYFQEIYLYQKLTNGQKKLVISNEKIYDEDSEFICCLQDLWFTHYNDYALKTILETGKILIDKDEDLNQFLMKNKIKMPYGFIINLQAQDASDDFIYNTNLKSFKRICKLIPEDINVEDLIDFYTFSYDIGCLSKDKDLNLRANNWLEDRIKRGDITFSNIHALFNSWLPQGEDKEFSDFLFGKELENKEFTFDKLKREKNYGHLIFKIYLEYKNKEKRLIEGGRFRDETTGNLMFRFFKDCLDSQGNRILKPKDLVPTVDLFNIYFSNVRFSGILTQEDGLIAQELSKWPGMKQSEFDLAKAIMREYHSRGCDSNIVGKHLKDMTNELCKYKEKSKQLVKEGVTAAQVIVDKFSDIEEKDFTYDWLEKDDPLNFVLGLYCNCCAILSGSGLGIVRASIIHPDVQTLVIRDKMGTPVAKSTIYVNRKEGYAVFNTVEVAHNIFSFREEIYKEYIRGIDAFANEYNKQNPNNPLKKITTGMHINDLEKQIKKNNVKCEVLKAIDFSKYGAQYKDYVGDWFKSGQYQIWVNKAINNINR